MDDWKCSTHSVIPVGSTVVFTREPIFRLNRKHQRFLRNVFVLDNGNLAGRVRRGRQPARSVAADVAVVAH